MEIKFHELDRPSIYAYGEYYDTGGIYKVIYEWNKVIKPKEGNMYFVWTIWQTGYRAYNENGEFHSINDGNIIKNVAKYN